MSLKTCQIFGPHSTDCVSHVVDVCKPMAIRAYGLTPDEIVCVETVTGNLCDGYDTAPVHVTGSDCCPLCLSACQNIIYLDVPGRYRFKFSGVAGTVRVEAVENCFDCNSGRL